MLIWRYLSAASHISWFIHKYIGRLVDDSSRLWNASFIINSDKSNTIYFFHFKAVYNYK